MERGNHPSPCDWMSSWRPQRYWSHGPLRPCAAAGAAVPGAAGSGGGGGPAREKRASHAEAKSLSMSTSPGIPLRRRGWSRVRWGEHMSHHMEVRVNCRTARSNRRCSESVQPHPNCARRSMQRTSVAPSLPGPVSASSRSGSETEAGPGRPGSGSPSCGEWRSSGPLGCGTGFARPAAGRGARSCSAPRGGPGRGRRRWRRRFGRAPA